MDGEDRLNPFFGQEMRIFSKWSKNLRKNACVVHVAYALSVRISPFLKFSFRARNGKEIRTIFLTRHLLGSQEAPCVTP